MKEKRRVEVAIAMDAQESETTGEGYICFWEASLLNGELASTGITIDELMQAAIECELPFTAYIHNMDFYGEFIIYWLVVHGYEFVTPRPESNLEFSALVSSTNDIYTIDICAGITFSKTGKPKKKMVRFINTSKIIPVDEEEIAEAFSIDPNLSRSQTLAKAVSIFTSNGLRAHTIGSDAMGMLKVLTDGYEARFPNLDELDPFLREAYGGAFLYCNPAIKDKEVGEGICLDVNSLYPWILKSKMLPFGYPVYYEGRYENQNLWKESYHYPLYIQHIRACFELKHGYLPVIQQKDKAFKTSQYIYGTGLDPMDLTLTNVELKLFLDHYDIYSIEYIDGYMFEGDTGMFTEFIDYWREAKETASKEGNKALRTISKLFLNNVGGKFATKLEFRSKAPFMDYDGSISYKELDKKTIKGAYLPVACFMISYAKDYIIRIAQKNIDRFLYSDTDSLHFKGWDIPEDIEVDAVKFGAFKLEHRFVMARFLHAKCYAEVTEDGEIKTAIAGLPKEAQESISFEDFRSGKRVYGKLVPFNVVGGAVLKPCVYTL